MGTETAKIVHEDVMQVTEVNWESKMESKKRCSQVNVVWKWEFPRVRLKLKCARYLPVWDKRASGGDCLMPM